MDADERHMRSALELAERGRGTTDPNPVVGCVLVRDGDIVGRGWHQRAGGPHAEVVALQEAGERARGATAYVTLEPCAHHGRTGPCTSALIEAGVSRVVYAAPDPHPEAAGGGEVLREAGVSVDAGVLTAEAERLNEVFLVAQRERRPFLTLKLAQSLDGRVTTPDDRGRWITAREARTRVHELRGLHDAVLVGSGTVLADDPGLDVRHTEPPRGQPRPVVLDARGRTPAGAAVAREGAIVATTTGAPDGWRRDLGGAGVEVVTVPAAYDGQGVDPGVTLDALFARDVRSVLCEGGPTVAGGLLRADLVDRLVLHVAPTVLGDDGLAAITGHARAPGVRWRLDATTRYGPDLELELRPIRDGG